MNNSINLLYIAVLLVFTMGISYYFKGVSIYEEKYRIYEGAFASGFEYKTFVSCYEIDEFGKSAEFRYTTDIDHSDISGFWEKYIEYAGAEYEAVYIKVRAEITKNDGPTWMGFSHSLYVKEVLDMQPFENRKCDPAYNPSLREIKVEQDRESPEDLFKRLKAGSTIN